MRAQSRLMSCSLVIASVVCGLLAGCGGSDLNGYRPLEKSVTRADENQSGSRKLAINSAQPVAPEGDTAPDSSSVNNQSADDVTVSALFPDNVVGGLERLTTPVVPRQESSVASGAFNAPASDGPVAAFAVKPALARSLQLLVRERTFRTDAMTKALCVSYDDLDLLKVLNLDPVPLDAVDLMPAWLKGLSGKRVRIRGFMYPPFVTEGIERFLLARDNQICCFGRDPKPYDLVRVVMKTGSTTNYIPSSRAFDVVGRFRIEMVAEDGKPLHFYSIEDARVIDR